MAQPPMDDLEEQLALLSLLQHWQNSVAERLLQTVTPPHILTASSDSTLPAEPEWLTAQQRPSLTITVPSSINRAGSIGAELTGDLPSPSSTSCCSLPSGGSSVQSFSSSQHGYGIQRRRQALQKKTKHTPRGRKPALSMSKISENGPPESHHAGHNPASMPPSTHTPCDNSS